jgi:hypothetical protein
MHALLALNWEPQLRGVIIIIISVTVLCGSIYLIIGTNIGARLGFLLTLSALAGWMLLMALVWWSFGIGLKGEDATWKPMKGETIILDPVALKESGVIKRDAAVPTEGEPAAITAASEAALLANGWTEVGETDKAFGPAASAAGVFVEEDGSLQAGEYQVVAVFDKGGARYPKISDEIDFTAFLHKPRWNLVEVATLMPQRAEPGRAPARAEIDPSQPHRYVYMIRNLGSIRVPAAEIALGSAIVFFSTCYLLHIRDRRVGLNRSQGLAVPAGK